MVSVPSITLDVIEIILEILDDEEGHQSLKACSLASHALLHPCRKRIFRSIVINSDPNRPSPLSTIRRLGDLVLASTPEIANYVRALDFHRITSDDLVDPNVPRVLMYFTQLQSLNLCGYANRNISQSLDWIAIALPIRTAFLRLMHLPTLTHLSLSFIENFTVYDLIPCTNLLRLEVNQFHIAEIHDTPEPWSILPPRPVQLQELVIGYKSTGVANKLVEATRPDGLPLINFKNLKMFGGACENLMDTDLKAPLKMTEQLTAICVGISNKIGLSGFADLVAPCIKTLKIVDVLVVIDHPADDPLAGLCDELKNMAGGNDLEALKIHVKLLANQHCKTGDDWGRLDKVLLTESGWPALERVSLDITIYSFVGRQDNGLLQALKNLPQTQLTGLASSKTPSFYFVVEEHIHGQHW
ncbi:hypothetical protein BDZ97DRAFT_1655509 [Flammula alnicola]|nr:hypothetical protein BDZ97DRAFT_1655509 [Flammula alnicola]